MYEKPMIFTNLFENVFYLNWFKSMQLRLFCEWLVSLLWIQKKTIGHASFF